MPVQPARIRCPSPLIRPSRRILPHVVYPLGFKPVPGELVIRKPTMAVYGCTSPFCGGVPSWIVSCIILAPNDGKLAMVNRSGKQLCRLPTDSVCSNACNVNKSKPKHKPPYDNYVTKKTQYNAAAQAGGLDAHPRAKCFWPPSAFAAKPILLRNQGLGYHNGDWGAVARALTTPGGPVANTGYL